MSRLALVLVLAAFACGGAFGYLMGAGTGGGADTLSLEGRGGAASLPRAAPDDRADAAADPTRVPDAYARAARTPARPIPAGTGTITGTVRDESGAPLAGVLVRGTWRDPDLRGRWSRGDGPPEDKDLDEILRVAAESHRTQLAGRRDAVTDEGGAFVLTGIGEGEYMLQAWLEGYELRGTPGRARAGDRVEFIGKRLVTVPVRVLLPDGTEPENARIECATASRGSQAQVWSPAQPRVRLDPGVWRLKAVGGDRDALRSEEIEVVAEAEAAPGPVTLALRDTPGIRGRVLFDVPEPNFQGQVCLAPLAPGEKAEPGRPRNPASQTWVNGSGGGEFAFPDLKPGTWFLWIVPSNSRGREILASATVEVGDGTVEQDLTVPAPSPEEYVVVSVEAPDGTPVADAQIYAGYTGSRGFQNGSRTQRLPDGTWRVFHAQAPDPSDATGKYFLQVMSPRFGQISVDYVPGRSGTLACRFEEPGFLDLTVAGLAGSGFEDSIRVDLRPADESRRSPWGYGIPGDNELKDGKASFGPLAPGRYDAIINLRRNSGDGGYSISSIARTGLDVGSGRSRQSIPLPPLYPLTVVVGDGVRYVSISSRSEEGRPGYSEHVTQEGGKVVFDCIPAGDYTVTAQGQKGSAGRMSVSVPGASVVEFRPMVVNAWRVVVTDPAGSMAKAGLRDGDLVVAIDGTECEDERQMSALLALARTKESSKLTVWRGGEVRQVEMKVSETYRTAESGGSWEFASR